MAERRRIEPNPIDRVTVEKIAGLIGHEMSPTDRIGWGTSGYVVNDAGAVVDLGLSMCQIDDEMLKELSGPLATLTSLTSLVLGGNQVSDLSPLTTLTSLTSLVFGGNQVSDLSPLASLTSLTSLRLADNQVSDLSPLATLTALTSLVLSGNQVSDLSPLTTLTALRSLLLNSTQVSDLSPLASLTSLRSLVLIANQVSDLSPLASLTSLTSLLLNSTQVSDLSPLASLTSLTSLLLNSTQVSDLSPLASLTSLTSLDLDSTGVSDLSPLASLTSLTSLDLGSTGVSDLSPLANLTSLTSLDLHGNQVSDLSPLANLTSLTSLDLHGNQVSDLSPLATLIAMKRLDLSNCRLKDIPLWLFERDWTIRCEDGHFENGLNLYGNPLETPPVEIVRKGHEAVLEYFRSLAGRRKRLNEVKVLLVGEGGAGKTSLLKRIFGERFDGRESQTKGIAIRNRRYGKGERAVKAHFWDFGGQVIMHSSHQFFLSRRSVYILVLDGRKEEDAEHWLQLIESFGGDSPILVVLNKMDENPGFELNRRFLQDKYKGILGFYRVSCKEATNNEISGKNGIIKAILRAFDEVEITGTQWGPSWFKVKKTLEQMKKRNQHFIDSTGYETICRGAEISDSGQQETLVDYLNDLGVVLHFKDLDLADMHVLEPHWVTDAVYRIINSQTLADNHGELRVSDLKTILRKRKPEDFSYPVGKHPYILKLMGKFELCYPMDDEQVLVPDLQDVQEPALPSFGDNPLRFYFEYSFLPSSVLPRFTVRMHHEIMEDRRWRTGLVVRNCDFNATAVVKSDRDRKRVYVDVYGDQKREYFSCIRREFFRIHGAFSKFPVTEWIPLPDGGDRAVSYANLYGHWKAGKTEYFDGETRRSYSVSKLLDGIETKEERLAGLLHDKGVKPEDIRGKASLFIQNIAEGGRGFQVKEMEQYRELLDSVSIDELLRALERRKKG